MYICVYTKRLTPYCTFVFYMFIHLYTTYCIYITYIEYVFEWIACGGWFKLLSFVRVNVNEAFENFSQTPAQMLSTLKYTHTHKSYHLLIYVCHILKVLSFVVYWKLHISHYCRYIYAFTCSARAHALWLLRSYTNYLHKLFKCFIALAQL